MCEQQENLVCEEEVECPLCLTPQPKAEAELGGLGNLIHYRCRYCGGQWHTEVS